ncbi:20149_t:CDS:2, partial [Racocetra fulgida]
PFPVDIAEKNFIDCLEISIDNLTVGHLKKLIWKQNQYDLADINPATLTLWKVEGLNEGNRKWEILEKKAYTEIDIKQEFGGEKLFSTMKFKEAFPVKLPDNTVHIIVQLPNDSDEKGEGQESKKAKLVVDRFAINEDGCFTFMGRKEFINVLNEINTFKSRTGYMEMFIYGTVGYGKSHILTAIACFLLRNGRRVVYLPDCRKLAVDPMEYIKSALFLTYVDDDAKTSEINACESFDQIIKFCRSLDETLYFIVDQMNALDDCNDTEINPEKKRQVKENIDKLCWNHFYIKSSSANNHAVLHLKQKQTNEKKITLYGGFDEPNDIEFFCDEKEIRFSSNEGKCILYLPRCWNQEAIDGLIISKTNNKLYVAPIQITLDKGSHSDSEGIFFSNIWPNLKSTLLGLEDGLEIIFIWITSKSDTDVIVEINSRKTRNKTFEINHDYTRVVMGFGNVNKDIDRYLF